MSPRRLQRKRERGWRKPAHAVIVDRTSRFGNPWRVIYSHYDCGWIVVRANGQGRWRSRPFPRSPDDAHAYVIAMFQRHLRMTPTGRSLAKLAMRELRGRDLICACNEGRPCHADVLISIANRKEIEL